MFGTATGVVLDAELTFGHVRILPAKRQLLVEGRLAAIGSRAFDLLLALVQRRDRVVSKTELLDLVWPGLVVEENNLSVQISALRKVLGAEIIATVTGRGYRFVADDGPARAATAATPTATISQRLAALAYGELDVPGGIGAASTPPAAADWRGLREDLIEAHVRDQGGRIVELSVRGMLIEFASAVGALRWAVLTQRQLLDRSLGSGEMPVRLRVAISIEDIILDGDFPVGEAAQIPARMLAEAPPEAAIVVSEGVRSLVRGRLPLEFRPIGERGEAWQVETGHTGGGDRIADRPALAGEIPFERPSVAVLPFACSDDDRYFGDGITGEIINTLSANRALTVIAHGTTVRFRQQPLPLRQIATELRVRYLLCGAIDRAAGRLRLAAELVDARSHHVIWSERFDGDDRDLFRLQADMAARIAGAIDPRVTEAEIRRVARVPTENLSAYDCVLRGLALQVTFREEDFAAAGEYFRRAIELDPDYAQAHAHLGWWHNLRVGEGRSTMRASDAAAAEALSMRAVALDPRDALILAIAAHIQGFVHRRLQVAMDMFEQALALNPSCAFGWARSATAMAFLGNGVDAQVRIRNAIRLSPFDHQGFTFLTTNGTASLVLGNYDEAVGWYSRARRANPRYRAAWRMLVAALALAGDVRQARAEAAEFIAYDPEFRVGDFANWYPMREPHLGSVLRGMRLAGLPE